MFKGFQDVSFSQIEYVSVDEALSRFTYLEEYPGNVYTRGSVKLNADELQEYEIALNMPLNSQLFYIRVLDAFRIYRAFGKEFIINGNSRLWTIEQLKNDPTKEYEFDLIPIQFVESEEPLTDEQIVKLQHELNDRTRKHKAIDKMRQLHQFIERAVSSGKKESQARKHAVSYFGVTAQTLSNAKKLLSCDNALLQRLLDSEQITTDAASIVIDRSVEFMMTIDHVLEAIARPVSIDDFYFKASNVKNWAESFRKIVGTDQERLDQYVQENLRRNPTNADLNTFVLDAVAPEQNVMQGYEAPKPEIDLEAVENTIDDKLTAPTFSPANTHRLARMLAAFPQKLNDNDCLEMFDDVLTMIQKYSSRLSDSDKANFAKALEQI